MADILCLGEVLVDWVCTSPGEDLESAQNFTKAPGGAPANTAVGLARQNISTKFVGRVSNDKFGLWLRDVLHNDGVDVGGIVVDNDAQTRMAYVVTTSSGDRRLAEFSKIACADARLAPNDLCTEWFTQASVLHFGSISLIGGSSAEAARHAVELARANKMLVSYDPNVRLGLWPSPEACRNRILETLEWADLVKVNEDELHFLTNSRDLNAADELRKKYGIPLLIVTLDSRGAHFLANAGSKTVPGFQVQLVEATGAGDGFNAGIISGIFPYIKSRLTDYKNNRRAILEALQLSELSEIVCRANAIGALTCTKAGAIPALPLANEVEVFLSQAAAVA